MRKVLNVTFIKTILTPDETGFSYGLYKSLCTSSTKPVYITAKGYNLPSLSDVQYEMEGFISGSEFEVIVWKEIVPQSKEMQLLYLKTFEGLQGNGAPRLYKIHGELSFFVMQDLDKLKTIFKANDQAEKIYCNYAKRTYAKKTFQILERWEFSDMDIMKIHKSFPSISNIIKEDPYTILNKISLASFSKVDSLAQMQGFTKRTPSRIAAAICAALYQGETGGDLFRRLGNSPEISWYLPVTLKKLLDEEYYSVSGSTWFKFSIIHIAVMLLTNEIIEENDFYEYIRIAVDKKLIRVVNVDNESFLSLYETSLDEINTARLLKRLNSQEINTDVATVIKRAENNLNALLSNEQIAAVKMALTNPVSIITGGPGTGKTSVQKVILWAFKTLNPKANVILAAPSGMAARRMSDSTGYPATTIHKLLNIRPDNSPLDICEKIDASLLIIDEASMIDTHLFAILVSRIKEGTQLILMGDANQLPPVSSGCVLKSLISESAVAISKLTKTFRQSRGSSIAINASRIQNDSVNLEMDESFTFIEAQSSEEIAETVKLEYYKLIEQYGEMNVACLTPYRRETITGSTSLNKILRKCMTCCSYNGLYVNDIVMYTVNSKTLSNGDIGKILSISKDKIVCEFNDTKHELLGTDRNNLIAAYSITIHKSQGNEYKAVIMVCDKAHELMLRKNLVYTGITRAKEKVICVGMKETFNHAILTEDASKRISLLGYFVSSSNN